MTLKINVSRRGPYEEVATYQDVKVVPREGDSIVIDVRGFEETVHVKHVTFDYMQGIVYVNCVGS